MMSHTQNSNFLGTNGEFIPSDVDISNNITSLDSLTILDSQTFEQ
jgi:hypothetical protein